MDEGFDQWSGCQKEISVARTDSALLPPHAVVLEYKYGFDRTLAEADGRANRCRLEQHVLRIRLRPFGLRTRKSLSAVLIVIMCQSECLGG